MAKRRARGEGSVRMRADGRWQIEITVGRQENGKPKKVYKYSKTQREAIEILNGLKAQLGLGIDFSKGNIKTGEWCSTWLDTYKQNLAPTTRASYSNQIRVHINPFIGGVPLNQLTTQQIQFMLNQVYDGGKNSVSLFVKVFNVLNGALSQAVFLKMINNNPCKGIAFPAKSKDTVRVLSLEEQKRFVKALDNEDIGTRALFMCYLMTGARLGELPPLCWNDVDFEERSISIGKKAVVVHDYYANEGKKAVQVVQDFLKTKNSRRSITITPLLIKILAELKQFQQQHAKQLGIPWSEGNLVFPTCHGTVPYTRNIQEKFERITKSIGIKGATMHWLRHTYATRLYESDVDIKVISEQLGHTSIKTTMDIYVTVFKEKKIKEMDKLNVLDSLIA